MSSAAYDFRKFGVCMGRLPMMQSLAQFVPFVIVRGDLLKVIILCRRRKQQKSQFLEGLRSASGRHHRASTPVYPAWRSIIQLQMQIRFESNGEGGIAYTQGPPAVVEPPPNKR